MSETDSTVVTGAPSTLRRGPRRGDVLGERYELRRRFDDDGCVTTFEAFDQECIEFRTPVCKEDEMKPAVALAKNAKFFMGALCIEHGHYFMIHNATLRNLDMDEFERPLHFLAGIADDLEEQYAGGDDY